MGIINKALDHGNKTLKGEDLTNLVNFAVVTA